MEEDKDVEEGFTKVELNQGSPRLRFGKSRFARFTEAMKALAPSLKNDRQTGIEYDPIYGQWIIYLTEAGHHVHFYAKELKEKMKSANKR